MEMTLAEAREAILRGDAPANLKLRGHLDLSHANALTTLPEGLEVTRLTLHECYNLKRLPTGLKCFELDARESGLEELPDDLQVANKLDMTGCSYLSHLPENLKVGTLLLVNCTGLTTLPEGLDVLFLDISGCILLSNWPQQASVSVGRLTARNCAALTELPPYLTQLSQLDVAGCTNLTELPAGIRVTSWLDIAETGITALPDSLQGTRMRWKGVLVDERIVFRPETLTGPEVLAEPNAEVRRIMTERMGMERFFAEVNAETLDRDTDPGGERKLLRVPMLQDEPIVCIAVACPSTGRRYVLRVPPTVTTCHQAAAWLAGFDDPTLYAPLAET